MTGLQNQSWEWIYEFQISVRGTDFYGRCTDQFNNGYCCMAVLSIEILVASDFDKVAGTAIYYLQYYYM